MKHRLAGAVAAGTRLRPRLPAATAPRTHSADRHVDRDDETAAGVATGQSELRPHDPVVDPLAEERIAHAFDDVAHAGKVDGDLIREAVVQHRWLVASDRGPVPGLSRQPAGVNVTTI